MLSVLRKGATSWLAQFMLLILAMSFGFFGIQGVSRLAGDKPVAIVGDTRIDANSLSGEFQREINRMRRTFGPTFNETQARQFGLDRQVLQRMIATASFDQRAKDLGLVMGDAVVAGKIKSEPAFQGVAGFDRFQFESVLQANRFTEADFVDRMRRDLQRGALLAAMAAGPPAPTALTEPLFRRLREQRIAQYFVIGDKAVPAGAAPSQEALEAFHKANAARFTAPELRRITLIDMSVKDVEREVAISEEDLAAAYEARKTEFATPEKREVLQFVIADKATAEAAAAKIEAGADFADVAAKEAGVKANELSLGLISAKDLPEEASAKVFAAPLNTFVGPVETGFGYMFLKSVRAEPGSVKPLDAVKADVRDKLLQEKGVDLLYALTKKVEDRRAGGDKLAEIAAALNLKVKEITAIDAQGFDDKGKKVEGLPDDPRILTDAFQLEAGQDADLIETKDNHFIAMKVEAITPSTLKPLDAVKAEVLAAWTADDRAKRLKAFSDDLLAKIKAGGDFAKAAAEVKSAVKSSKPFGRTAPDEALGQAASEALFAVEAGGVIAAPASSGAGFVIAKLERVLPVDMLSEAAALAKAKEQLAQGIASDLVDQYSTYLRNKYSVSVNETVASRAFGGTQP